MPALTAVSQWWTWREFDWLWFDSACLTCYWTWTFRLYACPDCSESMVNMERVWLTLLDLLLNLDFQAVCLPWLQWVNGEHGECLTDFCLTQLAWLVIEPGLSGCMPAPTAMSQWWTWRVHGRKWMKNVTKYKCQRSTRTCWWTLYVATVTRWVSMHGHLCMDGRLHTYVEVSECRDLRVKASCYRCPKEVSTFLTLSVSSLNPFVKTSRADCCWQQLLSASHTATGEDFWYNSDQ